MRSSCSVRAVMRKLRPQDEGKMPLRLVSGSGRLSSSLPLSFLGCPTQLYTNNFGRNPSICLLGFGTSRFFAAISNAFLSFFFIIESLTFTELLVYKKSPSGKYLVLLHPKAKNKDSAIKYFIYLVSIFLIFLLSYLR